MKFGKLAVPAVLLLTLLALNLPGCGTFRESYRPTVIPLAASHIDLSDTRTVKNVLYSQYDEWRSVRYREGGMSKKGIDCSGFVYLTYRSKLGFDLPRTTDSQSELGQKVAPGSLLAGDLVFFKTGFFQKHVGIFLEDRKFIHVSASRGVMISSLDDEYWSRKFWMAKRIYL